MYTSTLYTHLYIVLCEGATDYKFTVDWLCKGAKDYAYAMSWMCFVWCPVIVDVLVQCVCVVQLNCVKVQCMACCVSGSVM